MVAIIKDTQVINDTFRTHTHGLGAAAHFADVHSLSDVDVIAQHLLDQLSAARREALKAYADLKINDTSAFMSLDAEIAYNIELEAAQAKIRIILANSSLSSCIANLRQKDTTNITTDLCDYLDRQIQSLINLGWMPDDATLLSFKQACQDAIETKLKELGDCRDLKCACSEILLATGRLSADDSPIASNYSELLFFSHTEALESAYVPKTSPER